MRRSLILTVAAAVAMVLLAMLVPMAMLMRDYALEDRLSRAALEVQATETVVSGAGDDAAPWRSTSSGSTRDDGIGTTVLYPDERPRPTSGPTRARTSGSSRPARPGRRGVDDVDGGARDPGAGLAGRQHAPRPRTPR